MLLRRSRALGLAVECNDERMASDVGKQLQISPFFPLIIEYDIDERLRCIVCLTPRDKPTEKLTFEQSRAVCLFLAGRILPRLRRWLERLLSRCMIAQRERSIKASEARWITLVRARTIINGRKGMKVTLAHPPLHSPSSGLRFSEGYAPFSSLANRGQVFSNDENPGPGHYDVRNGHLAAVKVRPLAEKSATGASSVILSRSAKVSCVLKRISAREMLLAESAVSDVAHLNTPLLMAVLFYSDKKKTRAASLLQASRRAAETFDGQRPDFPTLVFADVRLQVFEQLVGDGVR